MTEHIAMRPDPRPPDRPGGVDNDVSFPRALVELFLDRYTEPGDLVFDPFVGWGTTMLVAEAMGRRAIGVELLPDRVDYVTSRVRDAVVLQGDARQLADIDLPEYGFTISSPPYMNRVDHPQNPLTGYTTTDADYARYIEELVGVYNAVGGRLRRGGYAVINVADIDTDGVLTRIGADLMAALAWDLALEDEVIVDWKTAPEWLAVDRCLVFRR